MQQPIKMVEDEQNQSKHLSSKRLITEQTLEDEEEDRISALPDCLIVQILSLLPYTKDAIRTGTLSKRWKSLWTLNPTLVFRSRCYVSHTPNFVSFVNKTLTQCRHSKLNKFALNIRYSCRLGSQFNDWIRYAITRKVEVLDLTLHTLKSKNKCVFDDQFFINSCFTDLTLGGCVFNPKGPISWTMLKNLCISYTYLTEDVIKNISAGSPVLETLELSDCYGYRRLHIPSKSVKNFVFSGYWKHALDGYDAPNAIEINAPNILSLKIRSNLVLWKLLLVDVSSLVEAELNYWKYGYSETAVEEDEEKMLKGLLQSLHHVKKLNIGTFCSKVLSRLKAKGFSSSPNIQRSLVWK